MIEKDTKDGKLEIPKFSDDMLFAPDAIHRDGKYYLYFCMADSSEGVAVADKPVGPFNEPVQLPCGGIDPAVFIDEGSIVNNIVTEDGHL
jgi:arabinoxylan arabinofuranohydrolase